MNERESDPTGAFRGGSAGLKDDAGSGTEYERHAPDGAQPGGGQPNTGESATNDGRTTNETPGVDEAEREVITSGTAATSEVADRDAQADAERQGDGTPLPR
ncbi:MAG: hypothetical protein H0U52_08830 [Chloroflexi bacterium]|nr:hypothetical protein [Chloroflexota bacterium]